jgi:hypothetical protein
MKADRCSKKSELFNGILTNLENCLNLCWICLNFWWGSLLNMSVERQAHPPVRVSLCTRISFVTSAEERSARRTALSSSRIMILAQIVPALVAWLRCWSYTNTFVNNFPECGFVHWYPIIRRAGCALNECASIVRENGKTNDSEDRSNIADIDHTPHRNRHLTVFHKHLRT